ncbi:amino acid adenylation domain-containing protein [Bacillus sp. NPDC077027]|uniref:amino acid adenylation domain-containing protein n=1 Tax=Bacillus sp. NPDC077027 TaxID=3390548 RepID=UPI003D08E7D9
MKQSILNEINEKEAIDAILNDLSTTILQNNQIERFAVFSNEKTIRPQPFHLSRLFLEKQTVQEAVAESTNAKAVVPALPKMPPALSYGGDIDLSKGAQTLQEVLRQAAQTDHGLIYVSNDDDEVTQSYTQLQDEAERVLTGLRALGLSPGDPVFFQFSSNHAMVTAFWACVLGGFVPTLVSAAPTYREMNAAVQKLHHSWELLDQPIILTDVILKEEIEGLAHLWETDLLRVASVEPMLTLERDTNWYPATPNDSVFFILTSGSTGMPKCVEHRHQSVLANVKGTVQANGFTKEDVSLDWMPLDHIGGIVMFHLVNVYTGCQQVRARTDDFIAQPLRWLDWIERYRATKTWAPNFAFALMNDYEKEIKARSWDLSSMKCVINGAEAVVPKTVHRFLNLLAPHGLKGDVMRPAFGMSEISSAVVFSFALERGSEESGVLTFEETSLTEQLRPATMNASGTVSFTELGKPIPGVTIRIVNREHELLPEDHIGRVQIKSPTTMKGYYRHDEANEEVFQQDGWFHTGDLGFLHEGRLTLTGREKDMIIINGKNFHNYEIEGIAEEVPGVETSFVAACSIRSTDSASDQLILFFTPNLFESSFIIRAVQQIKTHIATKMGINASYVVPVEKHDFPKTSSGKIERAQLSKRWQAGEFDDIMQEIDIRLENEQTLPDWSYSQEWIQSNQETATSYLEGDKVVFVDQLGLTDHLKSLNQKKDNFITVEPGQEFTQISHEHFIINPHQPTDYEQLFETIRSYGISAKHIIHLWNYTEKEAVLHVEEAQQAQSRGSFSALFLTKALAAYDQEPITVTFVSAHAMKLPQDQKHDVEKSTTAGLMTAVEHEWPHIQTKCLDFSLTESPASHAVAIMKEIVIGKSQLVTAYREGNRFVPALRPIDMVAERKDKPPFVTSGLYVVSGGLGGIGYILCEYLLSAYQVNLVLLGRRALGDLPSAQLERLSHLQEKAAKHGGSVVYEKASISDPNEIDTIILRHEVTLEQKLKGIIHFAGIIQEQLLADVTVDSLQYMYEAKVYGTISLHEVAKKRDDVLFISSSSARTLTGGMTVGAYCAANTFVEQFALYQKLTSSVKPYCFSFSIWDEVGMSEQAIIKDILKERGYTPISKREGLNTLRAGLMTDVPIIYTGLDRTKRDIRELTRQKEQKETTIHAFFKAGQTKGMEEWLHEAMNDFLKMRMSTAYSIHLYPEDVWAETADGTPDEAYFQSIIGETRGDEHNQAPQTETEKQLAQIWKELLDISDVSCGDHFFLLGGHSLKATQMLSTVRQKTGFDVPLSVLFEHARLGELASWIDEHAITDTAIPMAKVEKGLEVPMSYAQQRQWFLYQLEPDLPFYNNTISFRMKGPIDYDVLQDSVDRIVERHETLRTSFTMSGDEPLQIIHPVTINRIELIDLGWIESMADREKRAVALAREEANTPFRLEEEAVFRSKLVRLSEEDHLLLVSIHHIVSDGWSIGIVAKELSQCYTAIIEQRTPQLPDLPLQYADYSLWQKEYINGDMLDQQLAYWKEQFATPVPDLELPYDHPRPSVQAYRGKTKKWQLSQELSHQLEVQSRRTESTLYMTMLSAFSTLLHRLSAQDEFVIGSVIAGRNRAEIEHLIGFFVNTLALRMDHSGNPSFEELLKRVKQTTLGAYANQDIPFEMVVDELNIERDASKQPLFQVMFVLQNLPLTASRMGEATSVLSIEDNDTAKFDLSLFVFEGEEGLKITLEYNADLFADETMSRLLQYYENILNSICEAPNQPIATLHFMPEREENMLLEEWSGASGLPKGTLTLAERFDEQVLKTPDAIALEYQDERWTYHTLYQKADRLAAYLQQLGVTPHKPIGLLIDRTPEMILGVLAIIKAGGAYVPIDPDYPDARIEYMLQDTGIRLLLTKNEWLKKVQLDQTDTICLDEGYEEFLPDEKAKPVSIKHDQLAYINYTSGSTGQPKGVLIPHQAVVRLVCETDYVSLDESDRMLQVASFSFDAFTYEIWGALLNGGRLVLADRNTILSMESLAHALKKHQITTGFLTVPLFNRLTEEHPEALSGFKALLVGGDALSASHIRKALQYLPEGLLNGYGPTENTTFSCVHRITALDEKRTTVPIGKPIAYSEAYILNKQLQPVPQGVVGEIYVGGAGLALGYLGDEEKTNKSFIPHPFREGARLYKTGDMGKWLPDGTIDCLGRIDNQVKIRGHRVECGEIEAAILSCQGIAECAVVPHQSESGHKRLICYLVKKGLVDQSELRQSIKAVLPDYMIPSLFIDVDELPLTPNGKLDKKRLPASEMVHEEETTSAADRPVSEEEMILEKVWCHLLGASSIGVHENYFELGGDSIIVIQMVARLAQEGYVIQPKDVFEKQTISELAHVMKKNDQTTVYDQAPLTGKVRQLPIQKWFFEQSITNQDYWNLSAHLEIDQSVSLDELKQVLAHLLNHHDMLRAIYAKQEDGEWSQIIREPGLEPDVELIDLTNHTREEADSIIRSRTAACQHTLSLEHGELMKTILFKTGLSTSELFIAVHHLVIDGISWRILQDDLLDGLKQLEAGQDITFAPKTASYKQWADALNEYAQTPELKEQAVYWQQTIEHEKEGSPFENPQLTNTEEHADILSIKLTKNETDALLKQASKAYRTEVNDLLLAGLVQAFGQSILITLEGHGREDIFDHMDLSRTVGWFTSSYPIFIPLLQTDVGAQIKSVKETLRHIPQKGIGYGLLAYMTKQRFLQKVSPQISFNYLGQMDQGDSEARLYLADERNGHVHHPKAEREHLIDVYGYVLKGELHMNFMVNRELLEQKEMRDIPNRFKESMESIISHCLREKGGFTPSDFPMVSISQERIDQLPKDVLDVYPLSPMQQGMLFHALLDQASQAYFGQVHMTLEGLTNGDLYEQAWNLLIERHTILRTRFIWEGIKEPVQIVRTEGSVQLIQHDIRHLNEGEQRSFIEQYLQTDRSRDFRLEDIDEPLIRIALVRCEEKRSIFVFSFHHILIDGWSLFSLIGESFALYRSLVEDRQMNLPPVRPYKSFIEWLAKQDEQAAHDFWKSHMGDFEEVTPLPENESEKQEERTGIQQQGITLDPALQLAIEELAKSSKVTISTLIQSAWGLLLHLHSGMSDVVFGVTVSGRPATLPDVEKMTGLFINTLPLRLEFQPESTISHILTKAQEAVLNMREFEYTVLPDIQQMTNIPNGESLFHSIVVFENYPIDSIEPHGVKLLNIESHEETNYDLTLVAVPGDTLELRVSYQPGQYTEKQMKTFMNQLTQVLQAMAEQSDTPLSDFTIVTNEEREKLLNDWAYHAQVNVLYPDQEDVYRGVHDESCETEIYLLDEQHQLAAIGFPGEIYIGTKDIKAHCGEIADWMEAHKIPHPFREQSGEYLYQTGDVGVWTEEGNIQILDWM